MDIISIIKSVVLGIVEGVTEFLPVSSTGHLIIAERFLKLSSDANFVSGFEIVIQLGAILAIVVLYWNRLWPWASSAAEDRRRSWRLWLRVIVGIIPAFFFGFLLDSFITKHLFRPIVVAITLIFYGAVLIIVEAVFKRRIAGSAVPAGTAPEAVAGDAGQSVAAPGSGAAPLELNAKKQPVRSSDLSTLPLATAFWIGLFQTLALIPGTSRSAATIIGGMILGLGRAAAAEFSFFMAVPVMVGASALTIYKQGFHFTGSEWGLLAIGFVVAFLLALVVVRAFMNFLKRHDFVPFGIYRIAVGIVVIVLLVVLFPANVTG